MNPFEFIEKIRKRKLGNGQDPEAIEELHDMLNGAGDLLAKDQYTNDFHFIKELIQNADDNSYLNSTPTLNISFNKQKIILYNNEDGFKEPHIKAICSYNRSSKTEQREDYREFTGEKGIGFKSVFNITNAVEVYSNGFQFRLFSEEYVDNKLLAYVVPEWIEESTVKLNEKGTTLVLPLKERFIPTDNNSEKHEELRQKLNNLDPKLILFLRRLRKIIVNDELNNITTEIIKEVSGKSNEFIKLTVIKNGDIKEQNTYFFYQKNNILIPEKIKEKKRKTSLTSITLGFPLNEDNTPKPESNSFLYAYLPVKDCGFKFLINADFILGASRSILKQDSEWNKWLMKEVAKTFKETIPIFKANENYKYSFLNYIIHSDNDDLSNSLAEEIFDLCENETVFPTTIKDIWSNKDEVLNYDERSLNTIPDSILKTNAERYYLHPKASKNYNREIIELFGLEKLDKGIILDCLDNTEWLSVKSNKELIDFYLFLDSKFSNSYYWNSPIEQLKDKIIILKQNKTFSSINDETIYLNLPKSKSQKILFEKELPIINKNLLRNKDSKDKLTSFFKRLGVKDAEPKDIINGYIVPNYQNENLSDNDIISFTDYIREYFIDIEDDFDSIKYKIILLTNQGRVKLQYKNNKVYFPNSYLPKYNMKTFLDGLDAEFISTKYLTHSTVSSKGKWLKFFKDLGIEEFPKPIKNEYGKYVTYEFEEVTRIINDELVNLYLPLIKILGQENYTLKELIQKKVYKNRRRVNIDYRLDTTWFQAIKNAQIFSIDDKFYKPNEVYHLKDKNELELFENELLILDDDIYDKNLKLSWLGVNTKIELEQYISLLEKLKKEDEINIDKIVLTYKQLYQKSIDNIFDQEEIKILLDKNELIYSINDKYWCSKSEAIWSVKKAIFKNKFKRLSNYGLKLKKFFIKTLDVKEKINDETTVDLLKEYIGKTLNDKDKEFIEAIYSSLKNQLTNEKNDNKENIRALVDLPVWLNETDKLASIEDLFFVDDEDLYKHLKDSTNLKLYKVRKSSSKTHFKVIQSFFKKLDIYKPLSKAVKLSIIRNEKDSYVTKKELNEQLKKITELVIAYLRSGEYFEQYEQFIKQHKFQILLNSNIVLEEALILNYSINGFNFSNERQVFFDIQNGKIYIEKNLSTIERQNAIAIEIANYLDNIKGLDDFIRLLFVLLENEKLLNQHLKARNIELLHEEELQDIFNGKEITNNNELDKYLEEEEEETNIGLYSSSLQNKLTENNETEDSGNIKTENDDKVAPKAVEIKEANLKILDNTYKKRAFSKRGLGNGKPKKRLNNPSSFEDKKETGDWGEKTVFLSLIKELKKDYSEYLDIYEDIDNGKFIIYDNDGYEIIKLLFLNEGDWEHSHRDLELWKNGEEVPILNEVKSTKGNAKVITLSRAQWKAAKNEREKFVIYRVYKSQSNEVKVSRITNPYQKFLEDKMIIYSDIKLKFEEYE